MPNLYLDDPRRATCPNGACPSGGENTGNIVRDGCDADGTPRFRCTLCGRRFSGRRPIFRGLKRSCAEKLAPVVADYLKIVPIRLIAARHGLYGSTVQRLLKRAAEHLRECRELLGEIGQAHLLDGDGEWMLTAGRASAVRAIAPAPAA